MAEEDLNDACWALGGLPYSGLESRPSNTLLQLLIPCPSCKMLIGGWFWVATFEFFLTHSDHFTQRMLSYLVALRLAALSSLGLDFVDGETAPTLCLCVL